MDLGYTLAHQERGLTFWLQWSAGALLNTLLLVFLTLDKTGDFSSAYRILAILALFLSVPVYTILKVYYPHHGYLQGFRTLLSGWLVLLSILAILAFITKTSTAYSREVLLQWTLFGFLIQLLVYLPIHAFYKRAYERNRVERRAAILGTGELAYQLAQKITSRRHEPLLGLIHHTDEPTHASKHAYAILGQANALREIIDQQSINRLYIALPMSDMEMIESLYIDLLDCNVDVVWVPDLASIALLNHSMTEIDGLPAIHLNESPLTSYPASAMIKAVLDRIIAFVGIVAISPLLLAVAFIIKVTSPGPVLFKQPRHGMNGQVFDVLKFRSMRVHQDTEVKQATKHDSRITAIGRFIRRTSIDELPQLFNVLKGEMSLVGPRPHAVAHNNYYANKIHAYMARHRIKPGITGLAQISGARGETETIEKMQRRVDLDLQYINNWSLWLDIKILFKTPFTLFSKDIY